MSHQQEYTHLSLDKLLRRESKGGEGTEWHGLHSSTHSPHLAHLFAVPRLGLPFLMDALYLRNSVVKNQGR